MKFRNPWCEFLIWRAEVWHRRYMQTYVWFAWRPVVAGDKIVWLEEVFRDWQGLYWRYTLIKTKANRDLAQAIKSRGEVRQ